MSIQPLSVQSGSIKLVTVQFGMDRSVCVD